MNAKFCGIEVIDKIVNLINYSIVLCGSSCYICCVLSLPQCVRRRVMNTDRYYYDGVNVSLH
jgi:hypothetical protein